MKFLGTLATELPGMDIRVSPVNTPLVGRRFTETLVALFCSLNIHLLTTVQGALVDNWFLL